METHPLSSMFELLPIGTYRSSPSGRILRANRALLRLNGYDTEAELIEHFSDVANQWYVDPLRRQAFMDQIEREGHVLDFVSEIYRHKTRERIWVKECAHRVQDECGNVLFYEGTVEDITESRATRMALQESEALLRSITSQVPGMVYRIVFRPGELGRYTFVSEGVRELFGVPPQEVMASPAALRNLRHPEDQAWVHASILEAINTSKPLSLEFRILLPDGQIKWVAMSSSVAPSPGGDQVRVGVMIDITTRKLAETELSLRERFLAALTNAIPSMIAYWDVRCICRFANASYQSWFGQAPSAMVGAPMADIHSDGWSQHHAPWVALVLQGQRQRFEQTIVRKDGTARHVINEYIPDLSDGQVVGFVALVSDITEVKSRQLEFARLNLELKHSTGLANEASVAKSRFLANMSHEIRTPMHAILGMLTLLERTEVSAQQADYVGKAKGAANSLLALLNDILDLSKVESGKMVLDAQPSSLDKLLRDLCSILAAFVADKPLEVILEVDSALPDLLVFDAQRLQQVLINLASNAIKFTPRGEVILQVRPVRTDRTTFDVEFSVRDSGIGISPEAQKRMFSDFMQAETSTTRQYGGTGLGLAISRRLVKLMGGDITLSSEPDVGSTFQFVIPLQLPGPVVGAGVAVAPPQKLEGPRNTLIVEDNPAALEWMAKTVRAWGWPVTTATSGAQALERIAQQSVGGFPFQVVYLDWQLPDMDGPQVAAHLRQLCAQERALQPVLVMVSGHPQGSRARRAPPEPALVDARLTKPMTASMLLDAAMGRVPQPTRQRSLPDIGSRKRRLVGMRILVVEDNRINQQVARELLLAEGALVSLAANGQLGVDAVAAASPPFDVVLMDIQMPVMDGYAATRAIRDQLGLHSLPIIAMTANAMASDRDECLLAGMNDHVGKPFELNQLVRLLLRTMGRSDQGATAAPADTGLFEDGIDLAQALSRMSGAKHLYVDSAREFIADLRDLPERFRLTLTQDVPLAILQMHTLKGTAALLGARDLSRQAQRLEALCRSGADVQLVLAQSDQLDLVAAHTVAALTRALAHLKTEMDVSPTVQPHAAVPANALDLRAKLDDIAALLQASDLSMLDKFASIRAELRAVLSDRLDPLELAIQSLDLALALEACRSLDSELAGLRT